MLERRECFLVPVTAAKRVACVAIFPSFCWAKPSLGCLQIAAPSRPVLRGSTSKQNTTRAEAQISSKVCESRCLEREPGLAAFVDPMGFWEPYTTCLKHLAAAPSGTWNNVVYFSVPASALSFQHMMLDFYYIFFYEGFLQLLSSSPRLPFSENVSHRDIFLPASRQYLVWKNCVF